jgi:hypothetical protein
MDHTAERSAKRPGRGSVGGSGATRVVRVLVGAAVIACLALASSALTASAQADTTSGKSWGLMAPPPPPEM